jgi:hypothetical protein
MVGCHKTADPAEAGRMSGLRSALATRDNYGMERTNNIAYFARTNFRAQRRIFGIKQADRLGHIYIVGKTGTGKSTLLETLMRMDLCAGNGFALLDPHGDLVEEVRAAVPAERRDDLVYFNVPDASDVLGFNPLEPTQPAARALVASGLLGAFKKIWADTWGPRMEHILRNALLTLLDQPEATLADVLRLFDDPGFRRAAIVHVENPQVRRFWIGEFEQYPWRLRAEAIAPIQNKVGAFLTHPILNRILTQPRSSLDLRALMDQGGILLVNLAKGRLGEDAAALLGALLVSHIGLAGLGRAEAPTEQRRDFFLYLDEFHTFTTLGLAGMLSELRKYRVGMVLAHQYLTQLDEQVLAAVLGNVGTIVSFRVGLADAEILAREFHPFLSPVDLTNLPNHRIYLRLMIDGAVSRPFSAETIRASELPDLGGR